MDGTGIVRSPHSFDGLWYENLMTPLSPPPLTRTQTHTCYFVILATLQVVLCKHMLACSGVRIPPFVSIIYFTASAHWYFWKVLNVKNFKIKLSSFIFYTRVHFCYIGITSNITTTTTTINNNNYHHQHHHPHFPLVVVVIRGVLSHIVSMQWSCCGWCMFYFEWSLPSSSILCGCAKGSECSFDLLTYGLDMYHEIHDWLMRNLIL